MSNAVFFADITEIQNKCKKKPLKRNYLEVSSVDPVRYVVVSAEGDDVTGDDLKNYFENKAQSDGGNVHRVTSKDNGCFSVKFKNQEGESDKLIHIYLGNIYCSFISMSVSVDICLAILVNLFQTNYKLINLVPV